MQITYGLLCAPDGCPVAIEIFDGNTADPMTLATQVAKLKQRFHLDHVVLVGDRGMITQARITEDIKPAGLDWITALRAPAIKALLESGTLQLSLFDQRDMASITAPDFPGERLVVCRNPDLAAERARKREDLLAATERDLAWIEAAVARQARIPLRGAAAASASRSARRSNKISMAERFDLAVAEAAFSFTKKTASRRRGGDRRRPYRAHQPARDALRRRGDGAQLQIPRPGGTGLPLHQDRRSTGPARASLVGRTGARPCLPLHAGLLPGMAHASAPGADALNHETDKDAAEALRKTRGGAGAALTGRGSKSRPRV